MRRLHECHRLGRGGLGVLRFLAAPRERSGGRHAAAMSLAAFCIRNCESPASVHQKKRERNRGWLLAFAPRSVWPGQTRSPVPAAVRVVRPRVICIPTAAQAGQGANTMIRPKSMTRWVILSLTGVILAVGGVYAQQPAPQTAAPNPHLMGTEGLNQVPRALTTYMPQPITESFASLMARMPAPKPCTKHGPRAVPSRP